MPWETIIGWAIVIAIVVGVVFGKRFAQRKANRIRQEAVQAAVAQMRGEMRQTVVVGNDQRSVGFGAAEFAAADYDTAHDDFAVARLRRGDSFGVLPSARSGLGNAAPGQLPGVGAGGARDRDPDFDHLASVDPIDHEAWTRIRRSGQGPASWGVE